MQLTLIKKNKLSVFVLPEIINGIHWITDFENGRRINLLNVEAYNGTWELISNEDAYIVDKDKNMVQKTVLNEYNFYLIKDNYKDEFYYLYCSPVYDKNTKELEISTGKITIGSDSSANICYKLSSLSPLVCTIIKSDKYYFLNVEQNASVYINQKRVLKTKRLEYGDVIFTFGLKIILMRRDNIDYLLVNNPNNMLELSPLFKDLTLIKDEFLEDNKELNIDAYHEDYYFYRTPRFYKTNEVLKLKIDAPPNKKEDNKMPLILTIGPMATMGMTSVVMLATTIISVNNGARTINDSLTSIVMSVAMLGSCLLWPLITNMYQKRMDKNYEKKRIKLYKKYLDKKEKEIEDALEIEKNTLNENNISVTNCQSIALSHSDKLWQRRVTDDDFLDLPVGIGWVPMQVEIEYPEEEFSLENDELLEMAKELGKKQYIINNIPITFSFYENKTVGVIGDSIITKEFIDRLILQMMTHYSYDELKIVTFTSTTNATLWDYMKILPHSWANDKSIRYFGSSNDDYREIIYALEKIYKERVQEESEEKKKYSPHYVIVTDAIKSIDNFDFIKELMSNNENYGFSIIILVDKIAALPNECKNFINVSREECSIFSSIINEQKESFKIDFSPIDELYQCAMELSNTLIDIKSETEASLPDTYNCLEMFQIGKIEQLNSLERWKKSNPVLSLGTPVGIGKGGEVINLDIHEKYHGPHGLIAGTTGSGKSEFIITYILSLAINYHPYEVQVILIDYKGGSLAGAFSNELYTLPHLAGTITNLDGNELNRSLASIESEIKRRQRWFNDAKKITNESTMDIYKYQRYWREGRLLDMEPISHLIIISDEFAELKEQQPDFMEKLISVARVGRSLGIHLILATQKPGGVVDSQIWSNTRFRVCLKVQDTADSGEVLKRPDAAYLKKTGRFYLQVGYDEVFTLGQSAWTGAQYYPSNTYKKETDTSVNTINNIGFITTTKDIDNKAKEKKSLGEELVNIVKYLSDIANNENIKVRRLWLDKIPANIFIDALKSKYNFKRKTFNLNPIIGEYDDPDSQNQFALTVPFTDEGNAIVYGITGSGKEMFLTSLIYSMISSYAAEEVNLYILDFGSETLKAFSNSPYVGDVVFVNESDKVKNLFKMLYGELENRKIKFRNIGGTYQNYVSMGNMDTPNIVVVINNYDSFIENYENLLDDLNGLSREAFKYGIYFIITASNDNSVRMRTRQNFSLIYSLEQNSDSDYFNILGNIRGKVPAKYKGRGLFKKDKIYEFQTARIVKENERSVIENYSNKQMNSLTYRAKKIPALPSIVNYEFIKDELNDNKDIVVGVNKNKLCIEKINIKKNVLNIIGASEIQSINNLLVNLIKEINYFGYDTFFINSSNEDIVVNANKIYNNDFDQVIGKLYDYSNGIYKIYEDSGFNLDSIREAKQVVVTIYSVNDFINKINMESVSRFKDIITKSLTTNVLSFILVDSGDNLKNISYDEWFKQGADTSRGVWVGSGITEQSIFKINKYDREDYEEISDKFGYIISNSKLAQIKLLDDFNVKETTVIE